MVLIAVPSSPSNVVVPPETETHWVAVDGGDFRPCKEWAAYMVASGTKWTRDWAGVDDSDLYLDRLRKKSKLSFKEVKFVAAHKPSFAGFVVDEYECWLNTKTKLAKIAAIGVTKGSYMASSNVVEQIEKHEAYITMVTENPRNDLKPEDYLLSAAFVNEYNKYGSFMKQWIPRVGGALNNAQPHPFKLSMLMWHSIEHIKPMVDFLEKMCAPRNGDGRVLFLKYATTRLALPVEVRVKIFFMAAEENKKEKGDEGMELLFHWMFHVWGFGSRVPQLHKMKFDHLGQVERAMRLF
jgi:hypothetical protein